MIITSHERDIGGFSVRRILPNANHKMVGPFIFFDHIGPATFNIGQGIDVRPHPHIGLATVTYLFEGQIQHSDSLGSNQLIEPGAINWMVAGNGIVHSERTPASLRESGSNLSGIQCWIALPKEQENIEPSFTHHPASSLPEFNIENIQFKLLLGEAFGHKSPARVFSHQFYLFAKFPKGATLTLPADMQELAIYVVSGNLSVNDTTLAAYSMMINSEQRQLQVTALDDSEVMLLGGQSVGDRHIYWNFVASSKEEIEKAKLDWKNGPNSNSRFKKIPNDQEDYIPLPIESKGKINPKGNIM